jgi:N-acetylneuraminate synthase
VIDITRALKPYFRMASRPLIIINAGGFTLDAPMPAAARDKYYERIAESLAGLDREGIEIVPQTMPPFPWHFGGQRYHNLFVDPADITSFCRKHGYRVCLDVSHSKLACNYYKWSFKEFIDQVGPHTAHLHIVDAEGVDGEGLQIGEGDIDFLALAESLRRTAPMASFVPEIWQGHKNEGEGFWVALERLEKWFSV